MSIHIHHVETAEKVDDEQALEQFQKQWATYQKLVDHDTMAHKELTEILHDSLMPLSQPFDFLDIACGDAGQMKAALAGTQARHYQGIDLSEPALRLAAKNLEGASFAVDLDHGDFVAALKARQDPSDVSWCSLSVHHLSTDGKRDLLESLCDSTSKFLMIYEPTMLEGEDRPAYMKRFARVNQAAWTFRAPEEWEQIYHHVSTCDLPETAQTWMSLGREAGFAEARQIYLDPTGFYGLYRYDR
jgi:ubiquinone/menaquinone biosynthesis C-methylase UbiE